MALYRKWGKNWAFFLASFAVKKKMKWGIRFAPPVICLVFQAASDFSGHLPGFVSTRTNYFPFFVNRLH